MDTDGNFVAYIGVHKQEEGYSHDLATPGGLALSVDGKAVAVADTGNHRYTSHVLFLYNISFPGSGCTLQTLAVLCNVLGCEGRRMGIWRSL